MTQHQIVLNHLKKGPITSLQAFQMYGITRLAARIHELHKQGYEIKSRDVRRNNKSYSQYFID